jgi:hypothetical protein
MDYIEKMKAQGFIQHPNGTWYDPAPVEPNVEPKEHPHARWDREREQQDSLYAMKNTTDWR